MRSLPLEDYENRLEEHLRGYAPDGARAFEAATAERRRAACEIVRDKAQTLEEVWPLIRFLFVEPSADPKAWEKVMTPDARSALAEALEALRGADGFDVGSVESALESAVERSGRKPKDVYQPIRVAITGSTVSPGIFDSLAALGREAALGRIEAALSELNG
jgi:glutamyl-tRNA synthetase